VGEQERSLLEDVQSTHDDPSPPPHKHHHLDEHDAIVR
jgi:hypothetical protein